MLLLLRVKLPVYLISNHSYRHYLLAVTLQMMKYYWSWGLSTAQNQPTHTQKFASRYNADDCCFYAFLLTRLFAEAHSIHLTHPLGNEFV